ncbi:hypothetical protein ACRRTK_022037 [Alexandromys fortis]
MMPRAWRAHLVLRRGLRAPGGLVRANPRPQWSRWNRQACASRSCWLRGPRFPRALHGGLVVTSHRLRLARPTFAGRKRCGRSSAGYGVRRWTPKKPTLDAARPENITEPITVSRTAATGPENLYSCLSAAV